LVIEYCILGFICYLVLVICNLKRLVLVICNLKRLVLAICNLKRLVLVIWNLTSLVLVICELVKKMGIGHNIRSPILFNTFGY